MRHSESDQWEWKGNLGNFLIGSQHLYRQAEEPEVRMLFLLSPGSKSGSVVCL